MDLETLVNEHGGQAGLARKLGCNRSYINRAMGGKLKPALAVRIYRTFGHKLGPIANATPKQIEAIERLTVKGARG